MKFIRKYICKVEIVVSTVEEKTISNSIFQEYTHDNILIYLYLNIFTKSLSY